MGTEKIFEYEIHSFGEPPDNILNYENTEILRMRGLLEISGLAALEKKENQWKITENWKKTKPSETI